MPNVSFDGFRLTIDYTDRDFVSLVGGLRSLVTARFPQITDFNTSSEVEMIIELFSATFDRLGFMQDRQAQEVNIITARLRRNVINHARSIGYTPSTRKAATGTINITITPAVVGDVTISKDEVITTKEASSPQSFQLQSDVIILGGATTGTGSIKHSIRHSQSFESDGTPDQKFVLDEIPFIDDESIVLEVNAEAWEQKETFIDSSGVSKHFVIQVDENDQATIIFGDGTNGAIPPNAADIDVIYETGGGKAGNQAIGAITQNGSTFSSDLNEDVKVTVANAAETTGGIDRETTEEIRIRAPRALSSLRRTVTRKDFMVNVEDGVPGVVRAIAFSSDEEPGVIPENTAWVYIVPEGGGTPSGPLKDDVEEFLTTVTGKPIPLTMDLLVLNAVYLTAVVRAQVYIDKDATFLTAKNAVMDLIRAFFNFASFEPDAPFDRTIDFGKVVRWSRLVGEIQKSYGVVYIQGFKFNAQAVNTDLVPAAKEIPALDDSNFDTAYSGGGLEFIQLT